MYTSKTVDILLSTRSNQNLEFFYFLYLKMLADSNYFLDKMIQILRNLRSETFREIIRKYILVVYLEWFSLEKKIN